jgi:hypothetical protein
VSLRALAKGPSLIDEESLPVISEGKIPDRRKAGRELAMKTHRSGSSFEPETRRDTEERESVPGAIQFTRILNGMSRAARDLVR